jgi:hypothetical protein
MYIAASTAMETFQSYIDDAKEDVQELNNGMQTIQKMLQQLIIVADWCMGMGRNKYQLVISKTERYIRI